MINSFQLTSIYRLLLAHRNEFFQTLKEKGIDSKSITDQLSLCLAILENAPNYPPSIKGFLWKAYRDQKDAEIRRSSTANNPVASFERQNNERIQRIQKKTRDLLYTNNPKYQELDTLLAAVLSEGDRTSEAYDFWVRKVETATRESMNSSEDMHAIDFFLRSNEAKIARITPPVRAYHREASASFVIAGNFNPDRFIEETLESIESAASSEGEKTMHWKFFLETLPPENQVSVMEAISRSSKYSRRLANLGIFQQPEAVIKSLGASAASSHRIAVEAPDFNPNRFIQNNLQTIESLDCPTETKVLYWNQILDSLSSKDRNSIEQTIARSAEYTRRLANLGIFQQQPEAVIRSLGASAASSHRIAVEAPDFNPNRFIQNNLQTIESLDCPTETKVLYWNQILDSLSSKDRSSVEQTIARSAEYTRQLALLQGIIWEDWEDDAPPKRPPVRMEPLRASVERFDPNQFVQETFSTISACPVNERATIWITILNSLHQDQQTRVQQLIDSSSQYTNELNRLINGNQIAPQRPPQIPPPAANREIIAALPIANIGASNKSSRFYVCSSLMLVIAAIIVSCSVKCFTKN